MFFKRKPLIFIDFFVRTVLNKFSSADTLTAGQVAPPAKAVLTQPITLSTQYPRSFYEPSEQDGPRAIVQRNLDDVINAISLFWTSFFSFLRLEFHFLDPKSGRKKIRSVRMVGRSHRIWPDLEAPGTTPRTPKRLAVTARSSQKETHKC